MAARRAFLLALIVVGSAPLASCVRRRVIIEHDVTYTSGPREEVIVAEQPPAPQVEVVPAAPSVEHIWVAGYWMHRGGSWEWVSGRYVLRPHRAAVWVPGHWERHPRGWVWVYGRWR